MKHKFKPGLIWVLIVAGTVVLTMLLVVIGEKLPNTFWDNMEGQIFLMLSAYVFAILIAWLPIELVVDQAWEPLDSPEAPRPSPYYSGILGCFERALYVTAFSVESYAFVGIWLALKVAGGWKRWNEDKGGRVVFTVFLMGNALSLAYAFVGWQFIKWLPNEEYRWLIVCVPTLLAFALFGTSHWVRKEAEAHLERQNARKEKESK